MAYSKTVWKDREVSRPRTYTFQQNGDGSTTLIPAEGSIITTGTPITASNLNNIENYLQTLSGNTEIVEKGSGSGGHYMRWANGQQLCWGMYTAVATTNGNGGVFSITLPSKGLPASFSHTTYFIGFTPYFSEAVGIIDLFKSHGFF